MWGFLPECQKSVNSLSNVMKIQLQDVTRRAEVSLFRGQPAEQKETVHTIKDTQKNSWKETQRHINRERRRQGDTERHKDMERKRKRQGHRERQRDRENTGPLRPGCEYCSLRSSHLELLRASCLSLDRAGSQPGGASGGQMPP